MKINCSGFTLIEAIMVMTIMTAVVISVPPMMRWLRYQGVGHAVEQLRVDLQLARILAISRKQTCSVRFNVPGPNQYTNTLNNKHTDLSIYRGGVYFMDPGPEGSAMAAEICFNRQGMSNTVTPVDIFLSDQDRLSIYRIQILLPGGISVYRWNGKQWK